MVRSLFAGWRISAAGIESGTDAFLHAFDDGFVFQFDLVEAGSGTFFEKRCIADIGEKFYDGTVRCDRLNNVDRNAPWIKVEHQVREDE